MKTAFCKKGEMPSTAFCEKGEISRACFPWLYLPVFILDPILRSAISTHPLGIHKYSHALLNNFSMEILPDSL